GMTHTGARACNVSEEPAATPTRATKRDDAVTLRGVRVPLNSDVGSAFTSDCARNRERIFSDDQIREKYEIIDDNAWTAITQNKALRRAITAECERSMLNGDSAKESAANIFTEAPAVLGKILNSESASPKHRIDAARELRATANVGAEKSTNDTDRVVITINLGGDEKLVVDSGPLPPRQVKENFDAETE